MWQSVLWVEECRRKPPTCHKLLPFTLVTILLLLCCDSQFYWWRNLGENHRPATSYSPLHWSPLCYSCGVAVSFIGGEMEEKTTYLPQVTPLYTGHHSVTPVVWQSVLLVEECRRKPPTCHMLLPFTLVTILLLLWCDSQFYWWRNV